MKKLLLLLLIISFNVFAQNSVKIVALVNGDIISNEDIKNRTNSFLLATKIPMNEQTKPMIAQKVLHSAIDEKIKLQEAAKNGIIISPKEIDTAIIGFEKNNKMPAGSHKKMLKEAGISESAFRQQFQSDLAWLKLVRRKNMEGSEITQKEIETELTAATKDLNSPKRMVSEIFIRKDKAKNLDDLVSNLRQDPRFELYAMQFSDSPSAGSGGKLGWINVGKFEEPLEKALANMKEGEISNPILCGNGYYILRLEKNFDPVIEKPFVPSPADMKAFLINKKSEVFTQNYIQSLRQKAVIELRN